MESRTPEARYLCPIRPTGLRSLSTLVTLVSAMSVRTSEGEPRRCERTDEMGTAGTHAKVRYRCFLPDLAGFTSPRRPDHKLFAPNSCAAERVGFEPTIPFQIYTRSRRAPSAARPPLQRAESVGFEPTVPLPVRLISSQVPSTTRPALQRFSFQPSGARSPWKKRVSRPAASASRTPARTTSR